MFCTDIPEPLALIFSSAAPTLLYYSHLPAVFGAILLGLLVYSKNKSLESKLLLVIVACFSLWNLIDLVNWANVDSRRILFGWTFMNFFSVLVAAFTLYFSYVFIEKKDAPFRALLLGFLLLLPYVLALPTLLNINGFDLASCEAIQGDLLYYFYFLQAFFLLWLTGYLYWRYRRTEKEKKKQILMFASGVLFFLVSFFWGTLIGNLTLQWDLEQYGLFGMIIFLGLLLYLIVRYQAFNMQVIGAQALIILFVLLIGSQFYFITSNVNFILTGITLILSLIFAYFLIKSVKKEVAQREELQKISERLAKANEELRRLDTAKSEFISIASHQLRTPLTAIKGFTSLLLEGVYGKVTHEVEETLHKVFVANNRLMQLVENLLNISRIESGRIQYQFTESKIEDLIKELTGMFSLAFHEKALELKTVLPEKPLSKITMDAGKIREILSNLLDNALKYTQKGSVTISALPVSRGIEVIVEDTGMGIEPGDLPHLFKKFERGTQAARVNVSSTGLGLFVARRFAEAHGGTLTVTSEGKGKGSRFVLVLPLKPKKA